MPAPTTPQNGSPAPDSTILTTVFRQSLFYVLLFAVTGSTLPFMPVWFRAQGLSAGEIGTILAVPLLLRAVTGPLSGLWADRFALYRTPLIILAAGGCVLYALMGFGQAYGAFRFAALLLLWTFGSSCISSLSPMMDSMTLQLSRSEGFAYATPRAIGSAAFVVADVAVGYILLVAPPTIILAWAVAWCAALALGGRFLLGRQPRQDLRLLQSTAPAQLSARQRVGVLMRNEGLFWLLMAVGCLQAAHSFYYAFSILIWKAQGVSSATCGFLWAMGVVMEVIFIGLGDRLRRRAGPWRILVFAGIVGLFRWIVMTLEPPLWALWPLQGLHAITFASTYMAGLELVYRLTPKGYEGLAQSINSAYANGVMLGLGSLASGVAFEIFGARGYGVMAGVSAVGLGCALRLYSQRHRFMASPTNPVAADAGPSR